LNITTPQTPRKQLFTQTGNTATFGVATQGVLRSFVAWNAAASFPKPEFAAGKIVNQNLHGLRGLDMVILYHPETEKAAERLAGHRRAFSGLSVAAVECTATF
jgi:hypothetical protein